MNNVKAVLSWNNNDVLLFCESVDEMTFRDKCTTRKYIFVIIWQDQTSITNPFSFFPIRLLHQAALWDNAELLEDLLTSSSEELACLNARDSWGRTALHAAATNDDSQCLRILVQVNRKIKIMVLISFLGTS